MEVISALFSDCSWNMRKVLPAIKLATNREIGVSKITITAIFTLMESINPMVPKMVSTPVNSWVNPIRSPSENWLTSDTIRLKISPGWLASI